MIIFYKNANGDIIGKIDGRIHSKEQLKMWIGKKEETGRIVVNWKSVRFFDDKGKEIDKSDLKMNKTYNADFEPDHPQKSLMEKLDKDLVDIYKYRVDLKTKRLIRR